MDANYRKLLQQYRAEPTPQLARQLRNCYYRASPNDILFGQKPNGHLYHAWEYRFYDTPKGKFLTARSLCTTIGSGSIIRLAIQLNRWARIKLGINQREIKYCQRCKNKVDKGEECLTVGEAYNQALDRCFL